MCGGGRAVLLRCVGGGGKLTYTKDVCVWGGVKLAYNNGVRVIGGGTPHVLKVWACGREGKMCMLSFRSPPAS